MKEQIVAAISVAAFVAFAFGANAQAADRQEGGNAPPMAQPSGPSGPSSAESGRPEGAQTGQPSIKQENKAADTGDKDQMNRDRKSAKTGDKDQMNHDQKSAKTGDKDQMNRDQKSAKTGDKDQMDRDRKSAETGDKDQMDRDRKSAETGDKDQMDRDRKSAETGDKDQMDRDRKAGDKAGDQATVKIDSGEKEKVRTYFTEHRPTANRIEKNRVSVSIGLALPVGIALAPLPPNIIVVAADCPLQYFVWGDDVVLVDSCSREVVDIIPNIG